MIPLPILVTESPANLPYPDNRKVSGLVDRELGGVALFNPSQGLNGWVWTIFVDGNYVKVQRDGTEPVTLFTQSNIVDIALAFDQNMHPVVAWQDTSDNCFCRWYDTSILEYQILVVQNARTPRLTLDDKRQESALTSDVVFAYIANNALEYRLQRDRYNTVYKVADVFNPLQGLNRIGMVNYRLQFELNPEELA